MGQIVLPYCKEVYIDTSTLIYRVEQLEPYLTVSMPLWNALDTGLLEIRTSELTLLEVLVKPLRESNHSLVALYRDVLFGTIGIECLPIKLAVLEKAANIRSLHQLKTPDAIHAATALECQCPVFITNDPSFRRVVGLHVIVLDDFLEA